MVLGISPGTQTFGYVLMRDNEILYWGTKCFSGKWSRSKLKWIVYTLDKLIADYGVTVIAIKIPDKFPKSKGFNQTIGAINALLERRGLKAKYFRLGEVKQYLGRGEKVSKKEMFELLWRQYPELLASRRIEKIKGNKYYTRLFEAASVAHIFTHSHK